MTLLEFIKDRKNRKRLKEILHVFYEQGFGYLISQIKLEHYIPFRKRVVARIQEEKEIIPQKRFRAAFEELGPTFIKFGQLLSLRPDILPEEFLKEFEKMQDKVPEFPYNDAIKIIEKELGKPVDKIFTYFPKRPIASGSIAQVYKAKYKGKTVAIKVQRPGIKRIMKQDIQLMYTIVSLIDEYAPELKFLKLKEIVYEFEKWTIKELNFQIEAHYAKRMRQNAKKYNKLVIPKVYDNLLTGKVLVTEFIDGIPLHDVEKLKKNKINIKQVFKDGFEVLLRQQFVDGLFHADPHPGNILILKDSKIGLIDFGIVGHFTEELKRESLKYYQSLIKNDAGAATRTMIKMSGREEINRQAFQRDLKDLFDKFQEESIQNIQYGSLIREGLRISREHNLKVPIDFILFGKAIITLEGVVLKYLPNFDIVKEAQSILLKVVDKSYIRKEVTRKVKKSITDYKDLIETFPETLMEILDKSKKFKFMIDLEDKDIKDLTHEMERSSGNLSLGLIIAALIIGSSLIIDKMSNVAYVGLIISGILGIWIIKRTIF